MLISKRSVIKQLSLVLLLVLGLSLYAPITTYAQSGKTVTTKPRTGGISPRTPNVRANTDYPVLPSDLQTNNEFGRGVVLSKDGLTAVTASRTNYILYVYTRPAANVPFSNTSEIKLTPRKINKDTYGGTYFGAKIVLSDDGLTLVTSAPYEDVGTIYSQGVVYIFTRTPETPFSNDRQARITTLDGTTDDYFGSSLAISGDGTTLLVGAPGKQVNGHTQQGAVYVFNPAIARVGRPYRQSSLLTIDGMSNFGEAVALSSDGLTALVGADENLANNQVSGRAFVLSRTSNQPFSTQQNVKLVARDYNTLDSFGQAVALSSDGLTALVGAPAKRIGSDHYSQGQAYLFNRPDNATPFSSDNQFIIPDPQNEAFSNFGSSFAISDDGLAVVIAARNGYPGAASMSPPAGRGAVYVYIRPDRNSTLNDPVDLSTYIHTQATQFARFGSAVSISADGKSVEVGMPNRRIGQYDYQGEIYNFSIARF